MTVDLFKPFHLTREAAKDGIEAALTEKGVDYVYTEEFGSCQYVANDGFTDAEGNPVDEGSALCIVGKVLAHAGFDMDFIVDDAYYNGSRPTVMVENGLLSMDEDVLTALTEAQRAQDGGQTWGDAATIFRSELKS